MGKTVDQTEREYEVRHVSSILLRRMPIKTDVADLRISRERLLKLLEERACVADSKTVSRKLSSVQEEDELLSLGATEEYGVQLMRVQPPQPSQPIVSIRCAMCDALVRCDVIRAGACQCGQKYAVTFDGPENKNLERSLLPGCMRCARELNTSDQMSAATSGWRLLASGQRICAACDRFAW